jgi:tRNA 2-thiocytidine biosynthesis protein TtcA
MQRQNIKHLLNGWSEQFPGRIGSMFTVVQNVLPSYLSDSNLFDFKNIDSTCGIIDGGDSALDEVTIETPQDKSVKNYLNDDQHLDVIEVK